MSNNAKCKIDTTVNDIIFIAPLTPNIKKELKSIARKLPSSCLLSFIDVGSKGIDEFNTPAILSIAPSKFDDDLDKLQVREMTQPKVTDEPFSTTMALFEDDTYFKRSCDSPFSNDSDTDYPDNYNQDNYDNAYDDNYQAYKRKRRSLQDGYGTDEEYTPSESDFGAYECTDIKDIRYNKAIDDGLKLFLDKSRTKRFYFLSDQIFDNTMFSDVAVAYSQMLSQMTSAFDTSPIVQILMSVKDTDLLLSDEINVNIIDVADGFATELENQLCQVEKPVSPIAGVEETPLVIGRGRNLFTMLMKCLLSG